MVNCTFRLVFRETWDWSHFGFMGQGHEWYSSCWSIAPEWAVRTRDWKQRRRHAVSGGARRSLTLHFICIGPTDLKVALHCFKRRPGWYGGCRTTDIKSHVYYSQYCISGTRFGSASHAGRDLQRPLVLTDGHETGQSWRIKWKTQTKNVMKGKNKSWHGYRLSNHASTWVKGHGSDPDEVLLGQGYPLPNRPQPISPKITTNKNQFKLFVHSLERHE